MPPRNSSKTPPPTDAGGSAPEVWPPILIPSAAHEQAAWHAREKLGMIQQPWETARVLCLLSQMDPPPRLIVEIGCGMGGGLAAWQATGAEVIGVTIEGGDHRFTDHGATMVWGDSADPGTRKALREAIGKRQPDFVFIDGDHTADGVRADTELAMSLKPRLIGWHDIAHRIHGPDILPVYTEACRGRRHLEIVQPAPETDGFGLVWP